MDVVAIAPVFFLERLMTQQAHKQLQSLFVHIQDPRRVQGRMYPLDELLLITLLATICGATDLVGVCIWAQAKESWLDSWLPLKHGIPSHDTLGRVLSLLETSEVASMLALFVERLQTSSNSTLKHVAIDGKSVRGCKAGGASGPPLHLVQAWAAEHDAILGVLRVEGKENEIVAIPKLLDLLHLEDHVVTIDAIGCQVEIARHIRRKKADYILRIKDNQKTLHHKVCEFFDDALKDYPLDSRRPLESSEQTDGGHGRVETRRIWMYTLQGKIDDWIRDESNRLFPGLRTIIRIESIRYEHSTGEETVEDRHYLSSLDADACKHNEIIRQHWGIENQSHWVLDVAMKEDESRVQNIQTVMNLAVLRRVATAKLRSEKTAKVGVKNKALRCSADLDYLLKVLLS